MTVCHQEKNGRRDWAYDRIFDPSQAIDSDTVECRYKEWTYLACDCGTPCPDCGNLPPDYSCIVIAIKGVCRCQDNQNGTTTVKAAIGVYLAPESKHNETRLLQDLDNPPTSHRAELEAGIQALITIMNIIVVKGVEGAKLRMVIIKSDSAYLLQGVTHWVLQWKRHGVLDKRGEVIENAIRFMVLEELRRALEEVFHVKAFVD
ncbi:hypothetical protein EYB25_009476 [Talaromyces marneffei]|nr:hypothetical protein EYB25_009476 [Talaromyces marneffei]